MYKRLVVQKNKNRKDVLKTSFQKTKVAECEQIVYKNKVTKNYVP